jgi:hypothetical protein
MLCVAAAALALAIISRVATALGFVCGEMSQYRTFPHLAAGFFVLALNMPARHVLYSIPLTTFTMKVN